MSGTIIRTFLKITWILILLIDRIVITFFSFEKLCNQFLYNHPTFETEQPEHDIYIPMIFLQGILVALTWGDNL